MEEIEKLKAMGLDVYLTKEKYVQAEDLITACAVNINCSLAVVLGEVFLVRGTGKLPNLKTIAKELRNVIQHIAIFAHCLDVEIPEEEEIDEFIEEELPEDSQMDVILSVLSMKHASSNMVLEFFESKLNESNPFDWDMMDVGILDMLANCKAICNRFKLNFPEVIVYGGNL
jgi:hypothetical protein